MFAPLILCPRKLSPESLQSNHQLLTKAVAFMVDTADELFKLPEQLKADLDRYMAQRKENKLKMMLSPTRKGISHLDVARAQAQMRSQMRSSPVVNTMFSFVDR